MDSRPISKRRGRPRKSSAPRNPDEEHRRAQVRKAQKTFQARRQETHKAREERLVSLEAMVDHMGHAFSELADYIISSEACKEDSGMLGKLAAATAQVLALSRRSHDREPGDELFGPEQDPAPLAQQNELRSDTVHPRQPATSSAETDLALHTGTISSNQYWSDRDSATEPYDVSTIQNPFGNGWFGRLPRLPGGLQFSTGPLWLDHDSFAFRLLISTLQTAYWTLVNDTEDSTALSNYKFRFAFLYHDRQELQFNLRWFLGPGIAEVHLLMERNTAAKASIAIGNGGLLNAGVDLAAAAAENLPDSLDAGFVGSRAVYELFATVKDVDEHLKQRGVRHVDSDIIELAFPPPGSSTTGFDASIPQVSPPPLSNNIINGVLLKMSNTTTRWRRKN
ncbi:hypothetical protein LX32DRAFT_699144 [Colletotrichum zoysiae]|uniref:BZIP domain-containing protein n=1 Tax=Colletotrichum zoysiae TaxID=1216348 RepID=A0AAD9H4U2_9PEZI|nr:hypothetical protein LX32DRAFT_699144 [Colletotrichum zoysiae]